MSLVVRPIIAVDWDGTCVEQKWPAQGDWLPGAVKALKRLVKDYRVLIYTTRIVGVSYYDWNEVLPRESVQGEIKYIRRMLDEAGLEEVGIFESYPGGIPGKLSAAAYIDDKAVPFNGSWIAALGKLKRLVG
jgi:hypothetical protein